MTAPNGHFEYVTIDGDRWDLLAYRYYGDAAKQSTLLEANRHLFLAPISVPPLILASGITLIVPVIDPDENNDADLPPWKRKVVNYD